ncbi:MAG: c-type cytochrome domain-containing protein [Fuerstiella sp.]
MRNSFHKAVTAAVWYVGVGLFGLPVASHAQETPRARVRSFVETHCVDCHNDSESNGNFSVDALSLGFEDEVVRQQWTRIFDLATSGEMPPDPDYKPDRSELPRPANHSGQNLPVLVSGAGFERNHGKHIAYDRQRNEPLCNLFLSMLQELEIDERRFGTSNGPLKGLA